MGKELALGDIAPDIRKQILQLYIDGMSPQKISDAIYAAYGERIKPPRIYNAAKSENWASLREEVAAKAIERVKENSLRTIEETTKEHADAYRKLWQAGHNWLEDPEKEIRRAEDAIKALDVGIRGERAILGGVFNTEFVHGVINILVEEIKDQATLQRVAARLRALADAAASKET